MLALTHPAPTIPPSLDMDSRKVSERLTTISLFSGCGGMDLGAELAGANIVFSNDNDINACTTLKKHFANTEVVCSDIRRIEKFPNAELVIGGYPCQSFSMGGNRNPEKDARTSLFLEFARCIEKVQPKYFVAENVSGLQKIKKGHFLDQQIKVFETLGSHGYRISFKIIDAKNYGVPQTRKRLFIVGIRRDLRKVFHFPPETHGKPKSRSGTLIPYTSHGEVIKDLPIWPSGEFYERPHDPQGHLSWYYMSRNRKGNWDGPSYTIVANWRHVTIHPACPTMTLTWSNLADGWKQRWDFSSEYDHIEFNPRRPIIETPRRLSWRECARIQTFPKSFEPYGNVESKFNQIGNAVPPLLAKVIISHLISGEGLFHEKDSVKCSFSYEQSLQGDLEFTT